MIITKTPVRISFVGGGSDIIRDDMKTPGCVISTTIEKYVYVIIKKKLTGKFRISYSKNEYVNKISEIKNPIIKSTLQFAKIKDDEPLEIVTIADIPSSGSGLGSSSALVVGLLKAIYQYKNKKISKYDIAVSAYHIEKNLMKKHLGYQDHFNASYGGLRIYKFHKNNKIESKIITTDKKKIKSFNNHVLIFYTGINRVADKILNKMKKTPSSSLDRVALLSQQFLFYFKKNNFKKCGEIINKSWLIKKNFTNNVTNSLINKVYKDGMNAGAYGGKILGAGGGGYFIFICPKKNKKKIIKKLNYLELVSSQFENQGSKIIFKN